MGKRYFVLEENGVVKYWNITTDFMEYFNEYNYATYYGEDPTDLEETNVEFKSKEKCVEEINKEIDTRLKMGYVKTKEINLHHFMKVETSENDEIFSKEGIEEIEKNLGFKIPQAYIDLMKIKNGDEELRKIGDSLLDMTGFVGVDELDEMWDNVEDWGYPKFGIYFSWTESAGHEALLINYEECFDGEPSIWLLDQERESGRFLAKNFEEFITQLYFEDFSTRLDKEILDYYADYYNESEGFITKEFLKDWGFEYDEFAWLEDEDEE